MTILLTIAICASVGCLSAVMTASTMDRGHLIQLRCLASFASNLSTIGAINNRAYFSGFFITLSFSSQIPIFSSPIVFFKNNLNITIKTFKKMQVLLEHKKSPHKEGI